ncbi:hypothetical protein OQA88_5081 [Cercophora sp. LCS_1]
MSSNRRSKRRRATAQPRNFQGGRARGQGRDAEPRLAWAEIQGGAVHGPVHNVHGQDQSIPNPYLLPGSNMMPQVSGPPFGPSHFWSPPAANFPPHVAYSPAFAPLPMAPCFCPPTSGFTFSAPFPPTAAPFPPAAAPAFLPVAAPVFRTDAAPAFSTVAASSAAAHASGSLPAGRLALIPAGPVNFAQPQAAAEIPDSPPAGSSRRILVPKGRTNEKITFPNLAITLTTRGSDHSAAMEAALAAEAEAAYDERTGRMNLVFFTDGSTHAKTGPSKNPHAQGGYSIVYRLPQPGSLGDIVGNSYRLETFCYDNHQVEMTAIAEALGTALELLKGRNVARSRVRVFTDSDTSLSRLMKAKDRFTWRTVDGEHWMHEFFTSDRAIHVIMAPVVAAVMGLVKELENLGIQVDLIWMPRNKTWSQEKADELSGY